MSDEFEVIPNDEVTDDEVNAAIRRYRAQQEAARRIAAADFKAPDPSSHGTAAALMAMDREPMRWLLGPPEGAKKGILGARHNAVLIAQWKSGKTTLAMDLAKSLIDGDDFLGAFPVTQKSRVMFWSLEVEMDELITDFITPVGIKDQEGLYVFDGVGQPVNILTEPGKDYTVAMLKAHKTKVWMIDSLSVLAVWCGVNIDKDNVDTKKLFTAIDQIKREAGVRVSFVLAHTPRAEMEDGKERARGASAIDEHAGARWIFTSEGTLRFLRVNGRGVDLRQTSLKFNNQTNRSTLGVGNKAETRRGAGGELVRAIVTDTPGLNTSELSKKLKEALTNQGIVHSAQTVSDMIKDAIVDNIIERRAGSKAREQLHYLTGKATSRDVDFGSDEGRPRRSRR